MKKILSVLATAVLVLQSMGTSLVYAQGTIEGIEGGEPTPAVDTVEEESIPDADSADEAPALEEIATDEEVAEPEILEEVAPAEETADEPEAPAQDDNDPETVEPAEAAEEAEATPEDPEVTAPADDADVEAAEPEAPELEEPVVDPVIEPEVVAPTESEEVAPKAEPVAEPEAPVAQEPKAEETAPAAAPAEEVAPVEEKSALATLVKELKEVAPLIGWVDGIQVTVEDPLGGLPEGARMDLTPVAEEDVIGLIDSQLDAKVTKVVAVDITFYDANDQKIEPTQPINVKMMAWDMLEAQSVVHIDDEDNVEEVDAVIEGETARFESDSFSIYAFVVAEVLKVNFKNGDTTITGVNLKNAEEAASLIFDPGIGEAEGQVFRGWTTEKNYTAETQGMTVEEVKKYVKDNFNTLIGGGGGC